MQLTFDKQWPKAKPQFCNSVLIYSQTVSQVEKSQSQGTDSFKI